MKVCVGGSNGVRYRACQDPREILQSSVTCTYCYNITSCEGMPENGQKNKMEI